MDRVKGKVAIVTGGATGIGEAACRLLASEGATIAICDIDQAGEKVAADIREAGGRAHLWVLNTASEGKVKDTFANIVSALGRVDILVNNAGIAGVNKPTHEVTEDEWDAVMDVNVKGVFFCTKHVIPYMRKGHGGSIINLSSIYGLIGAPDSPPYHASKGAVRLMTKTDAILYAADHIRVNSIHPGYIWTNMVRQVAQESDTGVNAFRSEAAKLHPLGRIGEPNDVGWAIVYLASDESKFVTGAEFVIDGGYTAR